MLHTAQTYVEHLAERAMSFLSTNVTFEVRVDLANYTPESFGRCDFEKMLGVAKFKEPVGEFVVKPQGKPTLATADDKREC